MTLKESLEAKQGKALAQAVGVHPVTICAWKRGASLPPRTRIPALAAALGMEPSALAALVARERSRRVVGKAHRRVSCPQRRAGAVRKAGRS